MHFFPRRTKKSTKKYIAIAICVKLSIWCKSYKFLSTVGHGNRNLVVKFTKNLCSNHVYCTKRHKIELAEFDELFMTLISLETLIKILDNWPMQRSLELRQIYVLLHNYIDGYPRSLQIFTIFLTWFSDQVQCRIHCKQWEHTSIDHQSSRATKVETRKLRYIRSINMFI